MYILYGSNGCGKCVAIKNTLASRGVGFEYKDLDALHVEQRDAIVSKAISKGSAELPIITRESDVLTLEELIKEISN